VRGFLSFCLDMLAPPLCVHCGSEVREDPSLEGMSIPARWFPEILSFVDTGSRLLCLDCWLRLEPADSMHPPADVARHEAGGPMLVTPFFTNDVLLSLVRFLKFEGGIPAADPLSWWMASALKHRLPRRIPAVVTPVPLHGRRRRRRGYNQAALLAERVADRLGLPFEERILARRRHTKSQARLREEERERNVRNAFVLVGDCAVRGRLVVLVDDLVTSGGTIRSCLDTLRAGDPAGVAVLAAGRRKTLSYLDIDSRVCCSRRPGSKEE